MAQAAEQHIIALSDISTEIDDEPRVHDIIMATRLGFARSRKIRDIISRHETELMAYGRLAQRNGRARGQDFIEYYLNEPQALLICMWSNTAQAATVRKMLIDVFMEYRRQQLGDKPINVREHKRRTSTKIDDAIRLARSASRLEAVADRLQPKQKPFCAMQIGGESVFVDLDDFRMCHGDRAVIIQWDGEMRIMEVDNFRSDMMFAGRRAAVQPETLTGSGSSTRAACVIIGKVIEQRRHAAPEANRLRPATGKFRDRIIEMIGRGYGNAEIAKQIGCHTETVRRRRAQMGG